MPINLRLLQGPSGVRKEQIRRESAQHNEIPYKAKELTTHPTDNEHEDDSRDYRRE